MSERSKRISDLLKSQKSRTAYIKAKLGVLVPAQIRALRLKSTDPPMPYQRDLASEAELHQSRISMFETPGAANITIETLAKIAAALRVGVIITFAPFSEMLRWENSFSPEFEVVRLPSDTAFLSPSVVQEEGQIAGQECLLNEAGALGPSTSEDLPGDLGDQHYAFTGIVGNLRNVTDAAA